MRRDQALAILKQHEPGLRALGLRQLSLFGSTARDDGSDESDVDVAVRFAEGARPDLFQVAGIAGRLQSMLACDVDLVTEPARNKRLQAMIERDRVDVF